ncbi:uncharacterized protein DEA37_0012835 [Paragonimus westermani]|uniref:Reverse transcriptase domain-containing protein n=1 Tax=Paragonimus westermani TaxID=34504 RepID=A0A5J4NED4_9TREM|nr:uncharacterized protein DEA37_0012835 [Paragonimus westermani]
MDSTTEYASFSTAERCRTLDDRLREKKATGRPFLFRVAAIATSKASVSTAKGRTTRRKRKRKDAELHSVSATFNPSFVARRKYASVKVTDTPARLQLSSGSDITLILRQTWKNIDRPAYMKTPHSSQKASGEKLSLIDCTGRAKLLCRKLKAQAPPTDQKPGHVRQKLTEKSINKFGDVFQENFERKWLYPMERRFFYKIEFHAEDHQCLHPAHEDLFAKLSGGKCFARLDLAEVYVKVQVNKDSRGLLIENIHQGLLHYYRPPFGMKLAPTISQMIMEKMLTDLPGVTAYLDDINVMGTEHDYVYGKLGPVLGQIREFGFHFRAGKCNTFVQPIKYLGFCLAIRDQIARAERSADKFKRTLQKAKGDERTAGILKAFLLDYQTTRNRHILEMRSPAKALIECEIPTSNDLLHTLRPPEATRNISTKRQFIRRNRAHSHSFEIDQPVVARDYPGTKSEWTAGKV